MAINAKTAPPSDVVAEPSAAQILQFEIAARRARFEAYATASSRVARYEFLFPDGATVAAIGASATARDARDQLQLAIALTGGSIGKFPGGLVARVPLAAVERFEALAGPLIADFLTAFAREP